MIVARIATITATVIELPTARSRTAVVEHGLVPVEREARDREARASRASSNEKTIMKTIGR